MILYIYCIYDIIYILYIYIIYIIYILYIYYYIIYHISYYTISNYIIYVCIMCIYFLFFNIMYESIITCVLYIYIHSTYLCGCQQCQQCSRFVPHRACDAPGILNGVKEGVSPSDKCLGESIDPMTRPWHHNINKKTAGNHIMSCCSTRYLNMYIYIYHLVIKHNHGNSQA